MSRTLILHLLAAGALLAAEDSCSVLADLKATTYSFSPAALTRLEKNAKVKGLDRFWDLAKRDARSSAPCLRSLLQRDSKDSFFLFDASRLLWTIDKSKASAPVIAEALAHVNLEDVKPYDYVALAIEVANQGADTVAAALNFARAAHVSEYAAGAGTIMNREEGIVLLFGLMPEDVAVKQAIAIHQSGDAASPYALLALALALKPEALAYLRKDGIALTAPAMIQRQVSMLGNGVVKRSKEAAPMSRSQLIPLLKRAPDYPEGSSGPYGNDSFLASAFSELLPEDEALLRTAHRQSISDASPASLAQYYAYTQILQLVMTKAGMFRPPVQK